MICELCSTPVLLFLTIVTIIYSYLKWKNTYWEKRNFPYIRPRMLFGNLENPFTRKTAAGMELKGFYDEFKSRGVKHGGIYSFTTPVYIPIDLGYIKNILATDFQHFVERGRYYNEKDDPVSAHLFNIGGTKWKTLRVKFTPTFTSGKMKAMFWNVLNCGESLKQAMHSCCGQNEPVEIKDFTNKFTVDVIGTCVFGVECNSFLNPDAEFQKYGKMILKTTPGEAARLAFTYSFPEFSRFLGIRRHNKEVGDFFIKFIADAVEYRESNCVRRNDFLQILIDLKNNQDFEKASTTEHRKGGKNLIIEEMAAQAMVFFAAGYDASSTTIAFALYELASNTEIQQKVRDEINKIIAKYDGKLTYDGIGEMKYMQQVLDETLRKYPPLPLLNRQCISAYKIPGTDLVLEEGTQVIVPLLGLHRDSEHYSDPDKFDPERFSPENRKKIEPFSYLPFGDGPRVCIGLRFGIMQAKVALVMLLKDYKYSLNSRTVVPLEIALGLICSAKGGIWLNVDKIH